MRKKPNKRKWKVRKCLTFTQQTMMNHYANFGIYFSKYWLVWVEMNWSWRENTNNSHGGVSTHTHTHGVATPMTTNVLFLTKKMSHKQLISSAVASTHKPSPWWWRGTVSPSWNRIVFLGRECGGSIYSRVFCKRFSIYFYCWLKLLLVNTNVFQVYISLLCTHSCHLKTRAGKSVFSDIQCSGKLTLIISYRGLYNQAVYTPSSIHV